MVAVKIDTTWPATRVGLRPVKSCLGGHEEGVWGMTRRLRRHRSRYENECEWRCQNVPPSVVLSELKMIMTIRNETEQTERHGKRRLVVFIISFNSNRDSLSHIIQEWKGRMWHVYRLV